MEPNLKEIRGFMRTKDEGRSLILMEPNLKEIRGLMRTMEMVR